MRAIYSIGTDYINDLHDPSNQLTAKNASLSDFSIEISSRKFTLAFNFDIKVHFNINLIINNM